MKQLSFVVFAGYLPDWNNNIYYIYWLRDQLLPLPAVNYCLPLPLDVSRGRGCIISSYHVPVAYCRIIESFVSSYHIVPFVSREGQGVCNGKLSVVSMVFIGSVRALTRRNKYYNIGPVGKIEAADAFMIVTCEYNNCLPPGLLNLIGHFHPKAYDKRPSSIVCYSMGESIQPWSKQPFTPWFN